MKYTIAVKKNDEFARVYKKGRYHTGKYIILYALKCNPCGNIRGAAAESECDRALGVVASKKVGKSVRRNRLKRLIKENYRQIEEYIMNGYIFVFVVKAQQDGYIPNYHDIRREMKHLLYKAGAFDQQKWEQSQNEA